MTGGKSAQDYLLVVASEISLPEEAHYHSVFVAEAHCVSDCSTDHLLPLLEEEPTYVGYWDKVEGYKMCWNELPDMV